MAYINGNQILNTEAHINGVDEAELNKKVDKIAREDATDTMEYNHEAARVPYLYGVYGDSEGVEKQGLIKGSTGKIINDLAESFEESNPELAATIKKGIIPNDYRYLLDPYTVPIRDGNCAVPCGLHTYDKDESGNIINSLLYYGAAVPQGYMRAYVKEQLENTKKITSIFANYKYEFEFNSMYFLKSNSGNKDIALLDSDGNNVIGSLKFSYCLLILPKKTYQRTEYTATVDGHDRENSKINCLFAGMTNKGSLVETNNIQMLQFEIDPDKTISVTPSSGGISIFKIEF